MEKLNCLLHKFNEQGEKTGWTYIVIPSETAQKLNPENKKSFRAKGTMDSHAFKQVALIPMGEGDYIIPINSSMRKALKKTYGDTLNMSIEADKSAFIISPDMMACLEEDQVALRHFQSLAGSHQKYFSKWVDSAKGLDTKATRINRVLFAMQNQMDYGSMVMYFQGKK
ncbi:MAG: YdeI/OmpD-associated family protein [Flavobacteriales bacterium]